MTNGLDHPRNCVKGVMQNIACGTRDRLSDTMGAPTVTASRMKAYSTVAAIDNRSCVQKDTGHRLRRTIEQLALPLTSKVLTMIKVRSVEPGHESSIGRCFTRLRRLVEVNVTDRAIHRAYRRCRRNRAWRRRRG